MTRKHGSFLWLAAVLFAAGSAWGLADSPDQDPPIGLDFEDGMAGQQ